MLKRIADSWIARRNGGQKSLIVDSLYFLQKFISYQPVLMSRFKQNIIYIALVPKRCRNHWIGEVDYINAIFYGNESKEVARHAVTF